MTQEQKFYYHIHHWTVFRENNQTHQSEAIPMEELKNLPFLKHVIAEFLGEKEPAKFGENQYDTSLLFEHKYGCLEAMQELLGIQVQYHDESLWDNRYSECWKESIAIQYSDGSLACYQLQGHDLWFCMDGTVEGDFFIQDIDPADFPVTLQFKSPEAAKQLDVFKEHLNRRIEHAKREASRWGQYSKFEGNVASQYWHTALAVLQGIQDMIEKVPMNDVKQQLTIAKDQGLHSVKLTDTFSDFLIESHHKAQEDILTWALAYF